MKRRVLFLSLITVLAFLLRFIAVTDIPPGLYIDEVSNGLNAYTILTKGVDEHGVSYPLWFKAFGEYKLPVMIYLIAGSMSILGKTELAVRLPSILAGTLTVPLLFGLLSLTLQGKKPRSVNKDAVKQHHLALLPFAAAILLAITPWHLHFSRGGFEATIALFFTVAAVFTALVYFRSHQYHWLFMSTVLFALTMYTYNAYRVLTVLLFCFLTVYFFLKQKKNNRMLFINVLFFLLLITPVVQFSLSPAGAERYAQTSTISTYQSKSFNEKVQLVPMDLMNNYLKYFAPEYLFAVGDQNGRHQAPGVGLLYRWESIFFLIGIYALLQRKKDVLFFLTAFLLLIAPIPAALTIPSPHALRSLLMVIPLTVIVAYGIVTAISSVQRYKVARYAAGVLVFSVIAFEALYAAHLYTVHYPKVNVLDWGGAYKQTVQRAAAYADYDLIVIDRNMGVMAPYVSFYDDSLKFQIVEPGWVKPESMRQSKVLFIRPDYKEPQKTNQLESIRLPNVNQDIFAKFYRL